MKNEYDVVIVGAGPAGLSAGIAAAESGKKIAILDNNPESGGQIWRTSPIVSLPKMAYELIQKVKSASNIDLINHAKIVAAPKNKELLIELPNASFILHYQSLIICIGARELFLPFPGWTLPGVTGAGGLQALIKAGTNVKDERIVIAGSGPLLLAAADTAKKVGANVLHIAEQASKRDVNKFAYQLWRWPKKLLQAAFLPHQLYHPNEYIIEAVGQKRLEGVKLQTQKGDVEIECDRLACGFGLVPNTQLAQLLGCRIEKQAIWVNQEQATSQPEIFAAGECTGFGGSELSLVEGQIAGYAATQQLDQANELFSKRGYYQRFADLLNIHFKLREELKHLAQPETILCRCEDVCFGKVAQRSSWIDAKLHTRCGMGACQGSTCAAAAAYLFDWDLPSSRPPLLPTRIESLISMSEDSLN